MIKNYSENIEQLFDNSDLNNEEIWNIKEQAISLFRHIQIEAIEYAVRKCAEEAEIGSIGKGRSHEYIVDKQSILNVIDKIKEEL